MPDMRGFNGSSAPDDIAAYNISALVADTLGLIAAVTPPGGKIHLVGHDWGGMMVACVVAGQHPELLHTLSILNAPHPSVFDALLRNDMTEQKRSQYQLFFDTPAADGMDTSDLFAGEAWFDDKTRAAYRAAYRRSGGPVHGLSWYRANIFGGRMNVTHFTPDMPTNLPQNMTVATRTLVLWGMQDGAFDNEACIAGLLPLVPNLTVITAGYERVGHWIAQEAPMQVVADIARFIAGSSDGTAYPSATDHSVAHATTDQRCPAGKAGLPWKWPGWDRIATS